MTFDSGFGRYLAYATGEVLLIVIGILLAIQLSNWNDERQAEEVEVSYLHRLASEIRDNMAHFSEQESVNTAALNVIERFTSAINNSSISDRELVEATKNFTTDGFFLPSFAPTVSTFEDLSATGNLQLIHNDDLRESVIGLYTRYDEHQAILESNSDWLTPMDARFSYETDVMRWDERTLTLFPETNAKDVAKDLRDNRKVMTRFASVHFWVFHRTLDQYEDATALSQSVLDRIESELALH